MMVLGAPCAKEKVQINAIKARVENILFIIIVARHSNEEKLCIRLNFLITLNDGGIIAGKGLFVLAVVGKANILHRAKLQRSIIGIIDTQRNDVGIGGLFFVPASVFLSPAFQIPLGTHAAAGKIVREKSVLSGNILPPGIFEHVVIATGALLVFALKLARGEAVADKCHTSEDTRHAVVAYKLVKRLFVFVVEIFVPVHNFFLTIGC